MWVGLIVHDILQQAITNHHNGIRPLDKDAALRACDQRLRSEFRESLNTQYLENPSRFTGLMEHEYNMPVPDSVWKEFYNHAKTCVANFFDSAYYLTIKNLRKPEIIPLYDFNYFMLDDIKVFSALDFAYKQSGRHMIIDWKTGLADRHDDHKLQLGTYALFALNKWDGATLQNIKTFIYNLARLENEEYDVTEKTVEETITAIKTSSEEMQSLLFSIKHNTAHKERFKRADNMNKCRHCNFYRLCYPSKDDTPLAELWSADEFALNAKSD